MQVTIEIPDEHVEKVRQATKWDESYRGKWATSPKTNTLLVVHDALPPPQPVYVPGDRVRVCTAALDYLVVAVDPDLRTAWIKRPHQGIGIVVQMEHLSHVEDK